MKNDTKLIMETWRRFINEETDGASLETGFDPDDDSMPSEFDPEEGNYFDEESQGLDREEEYGFDRDPEDPALEGEPVPADRDLIDHSEVSMEDETEDDYFGHDFDLDADYDPEF
jgi:hypothetical protein